MFVFIEEDFILESIKTALQFLDKLVIIIDTNLDTFEKIKNLKNKKIKVIKINNAKKHFSYYVNKGYKKCNYKLHMKIDADQIYIKDNIDMAINYVHKNKNSIAYLSGLNCFDVNNKIHFLKKEIMLNSGGKIKIFNGGIDHIITRKNLLSRYEKFYFDNRIIERYVIPLGSYLISNFKYFGLCWLHYGPIKLGIKIDDKKSCEITKFVGYFNKNDYIKTIDYWIKEGVNDKQLSIFNQYIKNNNLNSLINLLNINNIERTEHQWAIQHLKNNYNYDKEVADKNNETKFKKFTK